MHNAHRNCEKESQKSARSLPGRYFLRHQCTRVPETGQRRSKRIHQTDSHNTSVNSKMRVRKSTSYKRSSPRGHAFKEGAPHFMISNFVSASNESAGCRTANCSELHNVTTYERFPGCETLVNTFLGFFFLFFLCIL